MSHPTISFIVPGIPKGKGRHRTRIVAGKGVKPFARTYTPEETTQYEALVRFSFMEALGRFQSEWEREGQFLLNVHAYFPRPASRPNMWHRLVDKGVIRYTGKPDIDNLCKVVADALNGLAWRDDSKMCIKEGMKFYCEKYEYPRVEVMIVNDTDPRDKWSVKR